MVEKNKIIPITNINNRIFTVRKVQVMIDSDLAEMYEVTMPIRLTQVGNFR